MQTKEYRITSPDDPALSEVGALLRGGGLAAIPTETVYGLAANALDGAAVQKIFAAKGRPQDNPLIVHIAALTEWEPLVAQIPPRARALADAFWPGPLTIILPKSGQIPDEVSAGLDTVAVRMPSHPIARAVIRAAGVPLAAPSANTSGRPSPTTARHVLDDLAGKIDAVVDGGPCGVGVESTVVTLAADPPRLLRPGGITPEQLQSALGALAIDEAVYAQLKAGQKALSPGMKYKHYAPQAHVIVVKGDLPAFCAYLAAKEKPGVAALCFDGEESLFHVPAVPYGAKGDGASQARGLFDALRRLDEIGADTVYARYPADTGVGLAVYNRLMRAAAFEVVEA